MVNFKQFMEEKGRFLIVALISITLVSMEITWTRIFSSEFFYNFAFLILSLAILGLGLGALSLRFFSFLNDRKKIGTILSLTALLALIGPPIVLHIALSFTNLFTSWVMVGKLVLVIFLLSSSFFCGGIALTLLFKQYHSDMPRLYMADLFGAGGGVFLALILMNLFGTPLATILLCIPIIIAAFITSKGWRLVFPVIITLIVIGMAPFAETLVEKPRKERMPVIYKHWDSMSKIKIFGPPKAPDYRGINIDNVANSPVYKFDGNWDSPKVKEFEFGIDVSYLIKLADSCTFMSLGAGGGTDVLQALKEGAKEIHAVEVNPHVNELMLKGELAEFSGHIYKDPRVIVVTEDARAYVRRFENKFDLIYSLSSNTFAALTSGAFAMAESYLFTTDAFEDYYQGLTKNGFMMMEHQFYMPRIVSEALNAMENLGIKHPKDHIAVYDLPKMRRNILLLSKAPLTEEIRQNAFGKLTPERYENIHLLYPAPEKIADNLINRIVTKGWKNVAEETPMDISPSTDNRPFTAQLGKWKTFSWEKLGKFSPFLEVKGFPISKILIIVIIIIILAIIVPLNILPYFTQKEKLPFLGWAYFFAIGTGFMIIEVVLIQRYTLFIGPSVYTIMATLFTLLLGSGIGSKFSTKCNDKVPFIGIVLWVLLEIFVFRSLTTLLVGLTILPRILVSAILILPLGFFLGMPFPKGAKRVERLIDWGFAVNGAASVFGAAFILLVSFSYGFNAALLLGAGFYFLAFLFINFKKSW